MNAPPTPPQGSPDAPPPSPDPLLGPDYQGLDSNVRSEPRADDASTVAQIGTPLDPDAIPIDPPKGTPPPPTGQLLDDVRMAELVTPPPNGVNGHQPERDDDVKMEDVQVNGHVADPAGPPDTPSAGTSPADTTHPNGNSSHSLNGVVNGTADDEDSDSKPPPAKRPRTLSNADQASITHSATPPPASASSFATTVSAKTVNGGTTPVPVSTSTRAAALPSGPAPPLTLSPQQHRFCLSTVRQLKKLKDAGPFLKPVDPVVLNIPHYPSIIKSPMDLSTIERKLNASNPTKPDANPENPRYYSADDFVADIRLIFTNTFTFNGPDHAVTMMGKRVEEVFDKQIKQMPPPLEVKPVAVVRKPSTPPPPPPPPAKKVQPVRRPSTSVPVIRRSDTSETIGRPKREIHPPPPKDLPYADAPKKARKGKVVKNDGTAEQLKYCIKILQELHKKQHYTIANPFYEPVDWVKLELPDYPKIVRKPMDLSTMRRKLDNKEYPTAAKFRDDFKLMINNCFLFNPVGTPVNQAGVELQRIFDEKWKGLPSLHEPSEDEEEEDEENSDEERSRAIAEMENQIETMRGSIAALKSGTKPKEKKKEKKREKSAAPAPSTSKAAAKVPKAAPSKPKKSSKKQLPVADDDVLTFEQKKDLSEAIQDLDGPKLERVIQIIHEGVPEIRDSTEEIELEIDLLPHGVLTKLYNFVLRPLRHQAAAKRPRTGKGTGTGGLKRKSMDEDVEAEKIRQLEERMRMFEQPAQGASAGGAPRGGRGAGMGAGADSDRSSDSSSGSDSSGSDTE